MDIAKAKEEFANGDFEDRNISACCWLRLRNFRVRCVHSNPGSSQPTNPRWAIKLPSAWIVSRGSNTTTEQT